MFVEIFSIRFFSIYLYFSFFCWFFFLTTKFFSFKTAPWWTLSSFLLNSWAPNFFILIFLFSYFFVSFFFSFLFVCFLSLLYYYLNFFYLGVPVYRFDIPSSLYFGFISIHPPLFYLALVLFFSFLVSLLRSDDRFWVNNSYFIFNCFGFGVLALLTGGYWSYSQTTWGFWWTWDPIELIILFLILLVAYCIHFFFIFSKINVLLSSIFFCFYLLYFVRLGLVNSKHSFFSVSSEKSLLIIFYSFFLIWFIFSKFIIFRWSFFILGFYGFYFFFITALFFYFLFNYLKSSVTLIHFTFLIFFIFLYNYTYPIYLTFFYTKLSDLRYCWPTYQLIINFFLNTEYLLKMRNFNFPALFKTNAWHFFFENSLALCSVSDSLYNITDFSNRWLPSESGNYAAGVGTSGGLKLYSIAVNRGAFNFFYIFDMYTPLLYSLFFFILFF